MSDNKHMNKHMDFCEELATLTNKYSQFLSPMEIMQSLRNEELDIYFSNPLLSPFLANKDFNHLKTLKGETNVG